MLSREEAAAATPDERIASVWRFMIRKSLTFLKTLKPQERSNFDIEDVLMELYVSLREKDDKWDKDRGQYITFAGTLADRQLADIRDRSRTVESPRNSSTRFREYQGEAENGTLTDRRSKTFDDIRRSSGEFASVEDDATIDPSPTDDQVAANERNQINSGAVRTALMALDPFEVTCITDMVGLNGKPVRTIAEIALKTGRTKEAVKKAKKQGIEKARIVLFTLDHPVVGRN